MATSTPETRGRPKRVHIDTVEEDDFCEKKMKTETDLEEDRKGIGVSRPGKINGKLNRRASDRVVPATGTHEKPAELFRKDLISAMKLADSEQLMPEDFFPIADSWRQEWERGVQVPVNNTTNHEPVVNLVEGNELLQGPYTFKLPRKYLHATQDETYKQGNHELHETQKLADQTCRYDLDDLDVAWLQVYNEERAAMGEEPLTEWLMEKVMEEIETTCYSNMQNMIKTVEGLGIEYDENVVCDVCRCPEGEDNNEIVFCDGCDICVHQACYGIQKIPDGSWLCRTCALGIKPACILCPKTGGAMKSTKSGSKWAHVSCALWIPEVSIGCPEKMEPITKITQISSGRWNLVCSVCRERKGACIQCCVRTCKTAFHVTCAFQNGLDMKTILDEAHDDVQLRAFCAKHTKKKEGCLTPRKLGADSPIKDLLATPKKESEMTEQEKMELRSHRLQRLAEEFYNCVTAREIIDGTKLNENTIDFIFCYWTLKRKANFNKPLLTPKTEEADLLSKQCEDSLIARMKMFIHLRQDLERVRNLCYMVSRREKMRRSLYGMKEEVFNKQLELLACTSSHRLAGREFSAIRDAHHMMPSIYDEYDNILCMARQTDEAEAAEEAAANAIAAAAALPQPRPCRVRQRPHRQDSQDSQKLKTASSMVGKMMIARVRSGMGSPKTSSKPGSPVSKVPCTTQEHRSSPRLLPPQGKNSQGEVSPVVSESQTIENQSPEADSVSVQSMDTSVTSVRSSARLSVGRPADELLVLEDNPIPIVRRQTRHSVGRPAMESPMLASPKDCKGQLGQDIVGRGKITVSPNKECVSVEDKLKPSVKLNPSGDADSQEDDLEQEDTSPEDPSPPPPSTSRKSQFEGKSSESDHGSSSTGTSNLRRSTRSVGSASEKIHCVVEDASVKDNDVGNQGLSRAPACTKDKGVENAARRNLWDSLKEDGPELRKSVEEVSQASANAFVGDNHLLHKLNKGRSRLSLDKSESRINYLQDVSLTNGLRVNNKLTDKGSVKDKELDKKIQSLRIDGLVSHTQLIVDKSLREKVEGQLGHNRGNGRSGPNCLLRSGRTSSDASEKLDCEVHNTVGKLLTKENSPSHACGSLLRQLKKATSPLLEHLNSPKRSLSNLDNRDGSITPNRKCKSWTEQISLSSEQTTPETRSRRRHIHSNPEVDDDHLQESVDGEVRLNSSRDTSPDRLAEDSLTSVRSPQHLSYGQALRQKHSAQGTTSQQNCPHGDGSAILIEESEASDAGSSNLSPHMTRSSLRASLGPGSIVVDENSHDGSFCSYGMRSRTSEGISSSSHLSRMSDRFTRSNNS